MEKRASRTASVTIDLAAPMNTEEHNLKNVCYAVLKELYKQLELDKFWKGIQKKLPSSMTWKLSSACWSSPASSILPPYTKRIA